MIELENVSRIFGKVRAVDNISLRLNPGKVYGFMGPNGAGKTTTLRMIAGILTPTEGNIKIFDYSSSKNRDSIKKITGLLPESGGFYHRLSAIEFLHFLGSLYDIPTLEIQNHIDYLGKFLNFTEWNVLIEGLSRGNKQKIMIIASLLNNPRVVLFDEPVATLDVYIAKKVKNLIRDLATKDKVVIISSHLPSLISEVCDYVIFLDKGKIVHQDALETTYNIFQSKDLETCYLLSLGLDGGDSYPV